MTKPTGLRGNTSGAPFEVRRTLLSTEILTLNSLPVELLPVKAGVAYSIANIFLVYRFGTVPYTFLGGDAMQFGYPGSVGDIYSTPLAFWFDEVSSQTNQVAQNGALPGSFTDTVGASFKVYTASADPADGDGEIDVHIRYYEIPVP